MWTIDHEDDIASDLSVFHRIDDPMQLDGPRYFMLVARLAAYAGVLQARVAKEMQDEREAGKEPHTAPRSMSAASTAKSHVSSDAALAMLAADGWAEIDTTKEG